MNHGLSLKSWSTVPHFLKIPSQERSKPGEGTRWAPLSATSRSGRWGWVVELNPGVLIANRYRLTSHLGQGGMGTVWAAEHTITGKEVALKFLHAPLQNQAMMRERFLREAKAASVVEHPNVVQIHDLFEADNRTLVMVMDQLHGETLSDCLKREECLSLEQTLTLLLPIFSAIEVAHQKKVIHRDLKPENIFLSENAQREIVPKVLDFGVAKLLDRNSRSPVTNSGVTLGTACYMAPEQSFGEKTIDHRADVWSCGVILYQCLTGVLPIEAEALGQFIKRLMTEAITPVEVLEPDLPSEVSVLIGKMLSIQAQDRPTSMAEVIACLRPFQSDSAPASLRAPISNKAGSLASRNRSKSEHDGEPPPVRALPARSEPTAVNSGNSTLESELPIVPMTATPWFLRLRTLAVLAVLVVASIGWFAATRPSTAVPANSSTNTLPETPSAQASDAPTAPNPLSTVAEGKVVPVPSASQPTLPLSAPVASSSAKPRKVVVSRTPPQVKPSPQTHPPSKVPPKPVGGLISDIPF
jgi:eukaryotic-like serine/threonine-protein kinase